MKIGTINFHRSQNYGALMVTYSLITYLKQLGYNPRPIDYFPEHHTTMYPNKNEPYDKFIREYLMPFAEPSDTFDLIIYGADTIWECYKEYGYDSTYWGDNTLKSQSKITFSASGTMKNFTSVSDKLFKENIKNFDYISVREDVLKDYLEKLTGRNILHTCDPTFLLEEKDYDKIMSSRIIEEEYSVIYNRQLGNRLFDAAKVVNEKTKLKTVVLRGDGCLYDVNGHVISKNIGPSEFLSLIKYSSYVLAASFHAVAFSIIFKKQFNTIMKSGSERVDSLLRKLGLEDRKIGHSKEIDVTKKIDYQVMAQLEEYIQFSKKYLSDTLIKVNRGDRN